MTMDQGRPSHVVASTSKSTPVRPPSSKPEPQSSITRDPIGGRSFSAALTWWLFRALVPLFIPPAVHLRGPEIFPFPPPIPATCEAEQWKENSTGWTITAVRSRNQPKAGASRLIILFHGGAFSHPIGPSHWRIAARFAEDLDAEVHVIPTPLAPENRAAEVLPKFVMVYESILRRANGREVIISGDSSGGNLALVLALAAAEANLPLPNQLVLLAPWLDISLSNPGVAAIAPKDPILRNIPRIRTKGLQWAVGKHAAAGTSPSPSSSTPSSPRSSKFKDSLFEPEHEHEEFADPLHNPFICPIHANLAPLIESQVRVVLVSGTYDILHADVALFVEKAEQAGLNVHYIEAAGQVHVFPLYHRIIPEGELALKKIVEAVKTNSAACSKIRRRLTPIEIEEP